MIKTIIDAHVVQYRDNGQVIAYVVWRDDKGKSGQTSGDPNNGHMRALMVRATREGVIITRSN